MFEFFMYYNSLGDSSSVELRFGSKDKAFILRSGLGKFFSEYGIDIESALPLDTEDDCEREFRDSNGILRLRQMKV